MTDLVWRKSSRSGASVNCVEVALLPGTAAVRDSKNLAGGHFEVQEPRWREFLGSVKEGRFDLR
ncbi:DUF397 domain-containing protein [Saccharopolyspora pogona]|uniref:DUF397 domain-containing protein n=1 Tax=Saccharopolyspora pogona TaxID=333966 RepID=UPI001684D466|nr:DUF397 domain-containing protein [Saccharopolyspora pogona]